MKGMVIRIELFNALAAGFKAKIMLQIDCNLKLQPKGLIEDIG